MFIFFTINFNTKKCLSLLIILVLLLTINAASAGAVGDDDYKAEFAAIYAGNLGDADAQVADKNT